MMIIYFPYLVDYLLQYTILASLLLNQKKTFPLYLVRIRVQLINERRRKKSDCGGDVTAAIIMLRILIKLYIAQDKLYIYILLIYI